MPQCIHRASELLCWIRETSGGPARPKPRGGLQLVGELVVGDGSHAAAVVHDEHDFAGARQVLAGSQRPNDVLCDHATGVADDVGVALSEPEHAVDIEPGVDTCLLYTSDAADDLTRVD